MKLNKVKGYVTLFVMLAAGAFMMSSAGTFSGARSAAKAGAPVRQTAPDFGCPGSALPASITSAMATPPADVPCPSLPASGPNQADLDLFSWQLFIAMNWPANTQTCGPNAASSIGNTAGPRVWETYLQNTDIMVDDPTKENPSPWCPQGTAAKAQLNADLAGLPRNVQQKARQRGVTKVLIANSKAQDDLIEKYPSVGQAVGGVLTDTNGRWVRYEIRDNKTLYTYIITNTLWSRNGQSKFAQNANFPFSSMELKAAWKVLGPNDDPTKFYTAWAVVFNNEDNPPKPSPGPNPVQVGLVGLHIMTKTPSQPNWVWSTFEHVDNAPLQGQVNPTAHYNFYRQNCTTCLGDNVQTTDNNDPLELNSSGQPNYQGVQVARVNAIQKPPTFLNQFFQSKLGSTVWRNYELVSTQWVRTNPQGQLLVVPEWLANMTMETYNQGPNPPSDLMPNGQNYNPFAVPSQRNQYQPFSPNAEGVYPSSSCLKCHGKANLAYKAPDGTKFTGDFVFILGDAN